MWLARGATMQSLLFVLLLLLPLPPLCTAAANGGGGRRDVRFEDLQEVVGHYALQSCQRTASRMPGGKRLRLLRAETCEAVAARLEHMVAVSGNDALMQLYAQKALAKGAAGEERGRRTRAGRRRSSAYEGYYAEAVRVATSGAHAQQLLKLCRKCSEWALQQADAPSDEEVTRRMEPVLGQWLINVASNSDPALTSHEMRDEPAEEPL
eukprot:Rhum_TRINITY_DN12461_c0_g1::Rhum_TRINITY_DN12461_c0_g1_i1::g.52027::m.52027